MLVGWFCLVVCCKCYVDFGSEFFWWRVMVLLMCFFVVRLVIVGGLVGVVGLGLIVFVELFVLFDIIDFFVVVLCRWVKGVWFCCDFLDIWVFFVDGLFRGGNGFGFDLKILVLSLLCLCDGWVLVLGGFGGLVEFVGLFVGLLGGDGGGCLWFLIGCFYENFVGVFMFGRIIEFFCKVLFCGSINMFFLGVDLVSVLLFILMGVWVVLLVVSMNEVWLLDDVCCVGGFRFGVLVLLSGLEKLNDGCGKVEIFELMEGDCWYGVNLGDKILLLVENLWDFWEWNDVFIGVLNFLLLVELLWEDIKFEECLVNRGWGGISFLVLWEVVLDIFLGELVIEWVGVDVGRGIFFCVIVFVSWVGGVVVFIGFGECFFWVLILNKFLWFCFCFWFVFFCELKVGGSFGIGIFCLGVGGIWFIWGCIDIGWLLILVFIFGLNLEFVLCCVVNFFLEVELWDMDWKYFDFFCMINGFLVVNGGSWFMCCLDFWFFCSCFVSRWFCSVKVLRGDSFGGVLFVIWRWGDCSGCLMEVEDFDFMLIKLGWFVMVLFVM